MVFQLVPQGAKVVGNTAQYNFRTIQDLLDMAFLCRILSFMDALLGVSFEGINDAFIKEMGTLCKFIKICQAKGQTNSDHIKLKAKDADIELDHISDTYIQAFKWIATN